MPTQAQADLLLDATQATTRGLSARWAFDGVARAKERAHSILLFLASASVGGTGDLCAESAVSHRATAAVCELLGAHNFASAVS